ncbi:MAG: tRNA 4-thiouridine(8) synthase ThiI [Candidatus Magasanikbacteria bacterium]|nr:tRNA 4-thiouridine(8) synthase ThiI [Candidatus Magasanikbacteria bacterium]
MNIIAHFDEIFLKGSNQKFFIAQLIKNLESLFGGIKVSRIESGLWIENFLEADLVRLALIPGIANFAPAWLVKPDLKEIIKLAENKNWGESIKTFRVKAERSDKNFPLNSIEVEKEVGSAVNIKFGYKVQLKDPEFNLHINIAKDRAIIFGNVVNGAGGLPVGTAGKVLCLLSGGIDSPIAAYQMMRRGATIELIHFQNQTKVTQEVSQKIIDLAEVLSRYQGKIILHIVPFEYWQKQTVMKVPSDYRMLITRRLMFKISEFIAQKISAQALVTGDSLGQVASQTLENLNVVYSATSMLKLSPLIGTNKIEIMNLAKKIGTLEISNRPYEDCCSLFISKHPQTKARLKEIQNIESKLDFSELKGTPYISYKIGMTKE